MVANLILRIYRRVVSLVRCRSIEIRLTVWEIFLERGRILWDPHANGALPSRIDNLFVRRKA